MNHTQRGRRTKRRQQHTKTQSAFKNQAILDSVEAVKKAKKKLTADNMATQMQKRGYLPDRKGGWRRAPSPKAVKFGDNGEVEKINPSKPAKKLKAVA